MIDPGSPNSVFPQVPSHDNLFEDNQAWGNDGYGLRVVASNSNTVRGNRFIGNLQGITLEQGSAGNLLQNNLIDGSGLYGIYLIDGADGIYLANGATNSMITHNTLASNIGYGIRANGADVIGNTWIENSVFGNSIGGITNTSSANGGIRPPTLAVSGQTVSGTTVPGAM